MKSNALRIGKLRLKETSEQHKPNNVFRKPKKEIKEDEFP